MISSIHGAVEQRGPGWVVVRVGGFGVKVFVPLSALDNLPVSSKEVHLHTHFHLREDAVALYGFILPEELVLFQSLITISGVGPKLALSVLSSLTPEQVAIGVASGNPDSLSGVPGVGKKIASRIVLELKGKLEKEWLAGSEPVAAENADVLAALAALGYTPAEAMQALSRIAPSPGQALEDRVTQALRYLGRQ